MGRALFWWCCYLVITHLAKVKTQYFQSVYCRLSLTCDSHVVHVLPHVTVMCYMYCSRLCDDPSRQVLVCLFNPSPPGPLSLSVDVFWSPSQNSRSEVVKRLTLSLPLLYEAIEHHYSLTNIIYDIVVPGTVYEEKQGAAPPPPILRLVRYTLSNTVHIPEPQLPWLQTAIHVHHMC